MICNKCLEEYSFVKFDVDPVTLEHRGIFSCGCEEEYVFPERMTREMIYDDDLREQLMISRKLHLQQSRKEDSSSFRRVEPVSLWLNNHHLERYIQHFSEQSARILKY